MSILPKCCAAGRLSLGAGGEALVFPNEAGNVESLANIINRGLIPAQIAAGVTADGKEKCTPACTPCGTSMQAG